MHAWYLGVEYMPRLVHISRPSSVWYALVKACFVRLIYTKNQVYQGYEINIGHDLGSVCDHFKHSELKHLIVEGMVGGVKARGWWKACLWVQRTLRSVYQIPPCHSIVHALPNVWFAWAHLAFSTCVLGYSSTINICLSWEIKRGYCFWLRLYAM